MPRLLDLFCGAGGAAVGYARAGFEVVGVDHVDQPNYPFEFHQTDALEVVRYMVAGYGDFPAQTFATWTVLDFDAIHASPPCQRFSTATKRNGTELKHPDLIGPTRELLHATGLPYVIENVVGAPLQYPVTLCGSTFGLEADGYRLKRHRQFERSWQMDWHGRPLCFCPFQDLPVMDVTGGGPTHKPRLDGKGGRPYKGTADQARRIMGIDWMTKKELNEAIPPAYTEFIGKQLLGEVMRAIRTADASWADQERHEGLARAEQPNAGRPSGQNGDL